MVGSLFRGPLGMSSRTTLSAESARQNCHARELNFSPLENRITAAQHWHRQRARDYFRSRRISWPSHAFAYAMSRAAVRGEMPSNTATSSTSSPTKYDCLTRSAFRGSWIASASIASLISNNSSSGSGAAASKPVISALIFSTAPPCRSARRRRALSMSMRRIASAAAEKNCARLCQSG
jgi:hypothetical protein